jgi:hypothetical protein
MELAVHLENDKSVVYHEGDELTALEREKLSPLQAYFALNRESKDDEREYLKDKTYVDIPEDYLIDPKTKAWRRKKNCAKKTMGVLYSVSPKKRETFFLRALLLKKKFPLSYEDVRTVDGIPYGTFREAAVAMGLVRDDTEYKKYVSRASNLVM